jgi:signal transduction histidine kinase
MASRQVARHVEVTRRIEEVSGIRPVTLLIASAIALITGILLVTGIAANHLRQQALYTANSELARVGSLLAIASSRSLDAVDVRLAEFADRLSQAGATDRASFSRQAAASETGALLRRMLDRFAHIDATALITAEGEVLDRVGPWPTADVAMGDLATALKADPARVRTLGAAIRDSQTGALSVPLAHRIDSPSGVPLGAVVGIVPASYFTSLFASVPLAPDAVIVLLRPDGTTLSRYPEQPRRGAEEIATYAELASLFHDNSAQKIRHVGAPDGDWRIEAWRALPDYPAAIAVNRSADQVFAEWAHQGLWFGGFALGFSIVIGVMVYLIARQFQTHDALATMRTERVEAEKIEIERARLAAEAELLKSERLSVLGQLTATVAHELRNPLSAIRNTLFTVKELAANAGVKLDRPIARMERSIERCDRIISDLLEYTRKRELVRSGVRFDRWLADMLAEQPLSPPIMLATELGAADAMVAVDADRVRRVVINLVENAAQALAETPPEREKRISVRTAIVAGEVVLAVEDTGPGIAPENLSRIFEPLFSTKSFGTGLGLPTVKQIINQHGGTIAVDSVLGRGTCVTVRLPVAAAADENLKVAA